MFQGNGTEAVVQVVVHCQNYMARTEIENTTIQKGTETDKETEAMISLVKEEGTRTGKRVAAEREMIMIRTEAGIGTGEDEPNKNISDVSAQI